MAWGCNPEKHPNGCGWASRATYPTMGYQEWWCDLCERDGDVSTAAEPAPTQRAVEAPQEPLTHLGG